MQSEQQWMFRYGDWSGSVMVNFQILQGLSFVGACALLLEEGYVEQEREQTESKEYDAVFIYPYLLLDNNGNVIDKVGHIECCMSDGEGDFDDVYVYWKRFA
ncbi:hypothetical protein ACYULU_03120 [Breznakiellaceae bacterium SP9]